MAAYRSWINLLLLLLLVSSSRAVTPEDCEEGGEFHLDPDDCPKSYFRCTPDGNGGWNIDRHTCEGETIFDPNLQICNWPDQVPDDVCDDVTHKPTGPTEPPPPHGDKKMICYFGAWAFYRPGNGKFDIDDIDPHVCTHLNYGFADMDNQTWTVVPYDPWYDLAPWDEGCDGDHCHYDSYRRMVKLKQKNKDLKVFLSIGGWNSGSGKYSVMAMDPEKRKTFVNSIAPFAKKFGFDGVDFDWEYPGQREGSDPAHDKEDFVLLSQEMAASLHSNDLLFTAAFSPDPKKGSQAYDIPRLVPEFDWFNIMTYDYHGMWDNFTGLNAPFYGRKEEDREDHPGHLFNMNDTINWYLDQGMPANKIVMGVPSYGRGFTLPDGTDQTGMYCPTVDGIPKGPYTRQKGIWGFYEVLQAFNNDTLIDLPGATPKNWEVTIDGCYKAPYAVNGPYWIGYDDVDSIRLKAQFANYMELAGVMIWSIETDDFRGDYHDHNYPLIREVDRVLASGESLDPENILGEDSGCESAPMCNI